VDLRGIENSFYIVKVCGEGDSDVGVAEEGGKEGRVTADR
jgi:hypothetical protein